MEWCCGMCGAINTDQVPGDSGKLPEFEQYENFKFQCASCNGWLIVNMNIPESEYEEVDLEVEHMPFFEINARKQIRDMIFAHRVDLKALKASDKKARRDAHKEKAASWRDQLHERLKAEKEQRQKSKRKGKVKA
jgi:hypothetical protein